MLNINKSVLNVHTKYHKYTFKSNDYYFKLKYCRLLCDSLCNNIDYYDYSFSVYNYDDSFINSIQLWISTKDKTIHITSGYMHNEPLPSELVDIIIDYLNLYEYTLN